MSLRPRCASAPHCEPDIHGRARHGTEATACSNCNNCSNRSNSWGVERHPPNYNNKFSRSHGNSRRWAAVEAVAVDEAAIPRQPGKPSRMLIAIPT
jgi:hypothetical protein